MIVPAPCLLWWTALGLVPLLAGAGVPWSGQGIAAALVGLWALMVFFDGARGWPLLDDLEATVPPILRWVKGRPAELPIVLTYSAPASREIRLGVAWPAEFRSAEERRKIPLPVGVKAAVAWSVTPLKRGRFPMGPLVVETDSPWKFWLIRRHLELASEVRVHPDLQTGLRAQAQFFAQGVHGGFLQRQVGKGREFDKLRDYIAGDGSDEIHWKATAKRQLPVTKVFQLERTQEVYVILDAARLSGRPVSDSARTEPLLEHALQAALLLAAAAERQGDLYGLATFSDRVHGFLRARNGGAHFQAARELLVGLHSRLVSPDFEELGAYLRLRLRRRALLLFLTNLEDPVAAEGFLRGVDLLRRQHLCVVVQPQSVDIEPAFAHGQAGRIRRPEDLVGVLAGHLQWQSGRQLELTLRRRQVSFVQAPPEQLGNALVTRYLNVKRRQLL